MPNPSSYHLSVKVLSRTPRTFTGPSGIERTHHGRCAVAGAAYRSGQRLEHRLADGRIVVHDFRPRRHSVAETYILAPHGAAWALDRQRLWQVAENAEKRKNSTVAREYEIALPCDLPATERSRIAREFAQSLVDKFGVVADVALHKPSKSGDQRNWHAHILTTTRRATLHGLGEKTRELDDRKTGPLLVELLRGRWSAICNDAFESAGMRDRYDHRSLLRQKIDRLPTVHVGFLGTQAVRRGSFSDRFEKNETIKAHNQRIDAVRVLLRVASRAAAAASVSPRAPLDCITPGARLTTVQPRLRTPKQEFFTHVVRPPAAGPTRSGSGHPVPRL